MKTRRHLLLAPLALLALALSGCVVVEHEDADLTFFWDFEGRDCIQAGVSQTVVEILDGPHLLTRDYVPCDATGVTLEDFEPGYYDYRISGTSPSGRVLYDTYGTVRAYSGDNTTTVSLRFVGW